MTAIKVKKKKWILYKHINDFNLIKIIALDVKKYCKSDVSKLERKHMQQRLERLSKYKARNPNHKPLDAINHRINTLEFFMFGYESKDKKFMFGPLGNLFLQHIDDDYKIKYIFTTMLFALQFEHPGNSTPKDFKLYPFRLIFSLLCDSRLDYKLYNDEIVYFLFFMTNVTTEKYEELVNDILEFRNKDLKEIETLLKKDEHTFVNATYEWEYYVSKIMQSAGVINITKGTEITKLKHPTKSNSKSRPTKRTLTNSCIKIDQELYSYIEELLTEHSPFDEPYNLKDPNRLRSVTIKEIYSFYPKLLLDKLNIHSTSDIDFKLMQLPKLIERYSSNPQNETAYKFEDVLSEAFNLFYNVEAEQIGGPGNTDIECIYTINYEATKKFAVDAKSTAYKLMNLSAGRLKEHRKNIGAVYTVIITPNYVPAVLKDIQDSKIVILRASVFAEYMHNHIYNDIREIDYHEIDKIIPSNFGSDISEQLSEMTLDKFAAVTTE